MATWTSHGSVTKTWVSNPSGCASIPPLQSAFPSFASGSDVVSSSCQEFRDDPPRSVLHAGPGRLVGVTVGRRRTAIDLAGPLLPQCGRTAAATPSSGLPADRSHTRIDSSRPAPDTAIDRSPIAPTATAFTQSSCPRGGEAARPPPDPTPVPSGRCSREAPMGAAELPDRHRVHPVVVACEWHAQQAAIPSPRSHTRTVSSLPPDTAIGRPRGAGPPLRSPSCRALAARPNGWPGLQIPHPQRLVLTAGYRGIACSCTAPTDTAVRHCCRRGRRIAE